MGSFSTTWRDLPNGATPGSSDFPINAAYLSAVDMQLRTERSDRVPDGLLTKLDQASGSAVVVVLGDSTSTPGGTGDWVIDVAPLLGARWLTHKVTMRAWGGSAYGSPSTVANASAALTLDVYNGSVSGTVATSPIAQISAMLPVRPDLIVINFGHNHAADTPATFQAAVDSLVTAARGVWVDVPVAVTSQNPRFSPAGNITDHAAREQSKRAWAVSREYGYVPAWEAFQAQATPSAFVQSDGIHPTISGSSDGSALWAKVVDTYLAARTRRPAPVVAASTGGGSRDYRWLVPAGATSIDEFNDDTLDAAWVRVDGTGALAANAVYDEAGDSLGLRLLGNDSSNTIHGLVRPLPGGVVAPGDAFVTQMQIASDGTALSLAGIVLADGTTFGSGKQIFGCMYSNGPAGAGVYGTFSMTNWNTSQGSTNSPLAIQPLFLRLVCVSAGVWRTDYSPNGHTWLTHQLTYTYALTPTHVGFCSSSWGSTTKAGISFEFLRRVSGVS